MITIRVRLYQNEIKDALLGAAGDKLRDAIGDDAVDKLTPAGAWDGDVFEVTFSSAPGAGGQP